MPARETRRLDGAERMTHQMHAVDAQRVNQLQQRIDVLVGTGGIHRQRDRIAMAGTIPGDHPAACRQRVELPHPGACARTYAMQQHQRHAGALLHVREPRSVGIDGAQVHVHVASNATFSRPGPFSA